MLNGVILPDYTIRPLVQPLSMLGHNSHNGVPFALTLTKWCLCLINFFNKTIAATSGIHSIKEGEPDAVSRKSQKKHYRQLLRHSVISLGGP